MKQELLGVLISMVISTCTRVTISTDLDSIQTNKQTQILANIKIKSRYINVPISRYQGSSNYHESKHITYCYIYPSCLCMANCAI